MVPPFFLICPFMKIMLLTVSSSQLQHLLMITILISVGWVLLSNADPFQQSASKGWMTFFIAGKLLSTNLTFYIVYGIQRLWVVNRFGTLFHKISGYYHPLALSNAVLKLTSFPTPASHVPHLAIRQRLWLKLAWIFALYKSVSYTHLTLPTKRIV